MLCTSDPDCESGIEEHNADEFFCQSAAPNLHFCYLICEKCNKTQFFSVTLMLKLGKVWGSSDNTFSGKQCRNGPMGIGIVVNICRASH